MGEGGGGLTWLRVTDTRADLLATNGDMGYTSWLILCVGYNNI